MELLTPFSFDMNVKLFIEVGAFFDSEPFINECRKLTVPKEIGKFSIPENLETITYGQRLDLSDIKPEDFLFTPLRILTGAKLEEILLLKACDVIRVTFHVIDQLQELNKRDEKYLKYEPSKEELKAGLLKMNHGVFGVIDNIARRMRITHDQVLDLSQQKVFMMLKIDIDNANYARNLRTVLTDK